MLLHIAEFKFPHAISVLPPHISPMELAQTYEKCAEMLESHRENASKNAYLSLIIEFGMCVLLTKKWLILVKMSKAFTIWKGVPFYLHPLSYVGIVSLPKIPLSWPQTAGIDRAEENPIEILKKCSS